MKSREGKERIRRWAGKKNSKNRVIASIPISWESNYAPKNNLTPVHVYSTTHKRGMVSCSEMKEIRHLILQSNWMHMEISEPAHSLCYCPAKGGATASVPWGFGFLLCCSSPSESLLCANTEKALNTKLLWIGTRPVSGTPSILSFFPLPAVTLIEIWPVLETFVHAKSFREFCPKILPENSLLESALNRRASPWKRAA